MQKMIFFVATLLLLNSWHCRSQGDTRAFSFESLGWKISVPSYLRIEDSAFIYTRERRLRAMQRQTITPQEGVVYDSPSPANENRPVYQPPSEQVNPEKVLLHISDTGWQAMIGTSMIASVTPLDTYDTKDWSQLLKQVRQELVSAYTKSYLPKATIDSVYTTETIGGKTFDKTWLRITGEVYNNYVIVYSRSIGGFAFHCAIYYRDTARGDYFQDIWKQSVFAR
ncbi:MAG: hypothetical protein ABW019_13350 [Chitinophagaceae bacterium]